jgi:hypothetical protein
MLMKWVSILVLVCTVTTPTPAQEFGLLLGTLHDSQTSRPIAGATIRIMATHIEREYTLLTDHQGRFAHVGLPRGEYIVTIAKEGYAALDVFDVVIERGEQTRLELTMTPSDRTPLKRQRMTYRRPLINLQDASIKYVFRAGA